MKKEAKGYGLTIEEACEDAKSNLILSLAGTKFDEDLIEIDVIAMPKKKALGLFGGAKAEVVAFIELPDEKPKREKAEKKTAPKTEKQPKRENSKKAEKSAKTEKSEAVQPSVEENTVPAEELPKDSAAAKAVAYLTVLLQKLGCSDIAIRVAVRDNSASLYLSGEGLGVVIGRRGETLDALQYLCSLAANSANGYYKITINIGNYRERRQTALVSLARRTANQVLRTGRNRTLEPMNPYERRIIHTTIQDIEGVTSSSVGEGSGRRVVIYSEKGGNKRGYNKSENTQSATTHQPKKDAELPLYGKIN